MYAVVDRKVQLSTLCGVRPCYSITSKGRVSCTAPSRSGFDSDRNGCWWPFTNFVVTNAELREAGVHKVSTTTDDPSQGVITGLKEACEHFDINAADVPGNLSLDRSVLADS